MREGQREGGKGREGGRAAVREGKREGGVNVDGGNTLNQKNLVVKIFL